MTIAQQDSHVAAPVGGRAAPLWEYAASQMERGRASQDKRVPGWLAAARRGVNCHAGEEPAMWPLYRSRDVDSATESGRVFEAEHICLVLFAFHQQSKDESMHVRSAPWAAALRRLRASDRFRDREGALDAKVYAAATSTNLGELQHHLRAIVTLLRAENIGFNYTALLDDLITWQRPGGPDSVRRSWGREYYRRTAKATGDATNAESTAIADNQQ